MKQEFELKTEFIKLGQILKAAGVADSGMMAKQLIEQGYVSVNGQTENRRGRKIYPNDTIHVKLEEMEEIYVSDGVETE
ncbi:RNA-binding S4 domain-containing protein [Clostridiales bacterium COT073_COT-073]|nr:RNA-binding S4 domain-containing protein [Clostridiales bacterium COT073_COT-073]